jgi:hypothetical protein
MAAGRDVTAMPSRHPVGPNRSSLNALLAEARRDDLLRTAAHARLAANVPRVRRGRLRTVLVALVGPPLARSPDALSAAPGDGNPAAATERDVPVEPRSVCG